MSPEWLFACMMCLHRDHGLVPAAGESPGGGTAPSRGRTGTLNQRDEAAQDVEDSRDRVATLAATALRIGASLDLDTVLREVVGDARDQTARPYGVITTVDDAGQPATSSPPASRPTSAG